MRKLLVLALVALGLTVALPVAPASAAVTHSAVHTAKTVKTKLLLLTDRALDQDAEGPIPATRMLRTPFSSATLANAIFDVLKASATLRAREGSTASSR